MNYIPIDVFGATAFKFKRHRIDSLKVIQKNLQAIVVT